MFCKSLIVCWFSATHSAVRHALAPVLITRHRAEGAIHSMHPYKRPVTTPEKMLKHRHFSFSRSTALQKGVHQSIRFIAAVAFHVGLDACARAIRHAHAIPIHDETLLNAHRFSSAAQ
jgi:hypothetical protein